MSVIVDFAGENGLVDRQKKKFDGLPPSSIPYIRPPTPAQLYQCNNISNMILLSTCTLVQKIIGNMLDCEFLGLTCAEGRNRTLTKNPQQSLFLT